MAAPRIGPDGLLLCDDVEHLTIPRFRALLERRQPFTVKSDYRGLSVPVDELDIVQLIPERVDALAPGTLILEVGPEPDGFTFRWTTRAARAGDGLVARVVTIDRLGRRIRLDRGRWRVIGGLAAASPLAARALEMWCRRITPLTMRLFRSGPLPITLAPPEALIRSVDDKRASPAEIRYAAKHAGTHLEPEEEAVLDDAGIAGGRALVVACGVGREVIALAQRGYDVTGIDSVPVLLDVARELASRDGAKARFARVAVDAPLDLGDAFDLVWCPPLSYEHVPGRERRILWLRRLAGTLAPGGAIVMLPGYKRDRGPRRGAVDALRWMLRRLLGRRFTTEPGDRLIRNLSFASDRREPCFFHAFQSPDEIRREIEDAGLTARHDPTGAWVVTLPRS